MIHSILALTLVFGSVQDFDSASANGLDSQQIARGWISLFDGETLFGWRNESAADWKVSSGVLECQSGKPGLLRTAVQFDDFELFVEFQSEPETNSGIFVRTSPRPVDPLRDCFEINIAPESNPFPTGSIVARHRFAAASTKQKEWNTLRVKAEGGRIQAWLNDAICCDRDDWQNPLDRGYIGLQFNSGLIRFRKVFVRPLNLNSLFNGRDSENWNTNLLRESNIAIDPPNHLLRLSGGPGQIESNQHYSNFFLFAVARTNGSQINSGIFFRCVPGEFQNGYESQIYHGIESHGNLNSDEPRTGSIFRRNLARFANASDNDWFAKMIIADGATICIWVNGLQVSDWTDQRADAENPRRGRRLRHGSIILQGHDDATNIDFKQIQAREFKPRRGP